MTKYSKSSIRVQDPYSFLALNVFNESFRTIELYFKGEGSDEERIDGRESLKWMKKMSGNFRILAAATSIPLDEFHQMCIWKINEIKHKCFENKENKK